MDNQSMNKIKYFICQALTLTTLLFQATLVSAENAPNIIELKTPSSRNMVALTEDKQGLFFSMDGGRRWQQAEGLPDAYLYHISKGENDDELFLTTGAGLFLSRNSGALWNRISQENMAFILFSPKGGKCLVKIWGRGLFYAPSKYFLSKNDVRGVSTDEKRVLLKQEIAQKSLALAQMMNNLKVEMGLKKSDPSDFRNLDLDKSRRFLEKIKPYSDEIKALKARLKTLKPGNEARLKPVEGLPSEPVLCAAYLNDQEAFSGFFGKGVYRSTDGGQSWSDAGQGLLNRDILVLASDHNRHVFAGTYGGGLYRYSFKQSRWHKLSVGLKTGIVTCISFAPDGTILVGTRGEGMRISRDGGETWSAVSGGLERANVQAVAVAADMTLWAGVYGRGLFVSKDAGQSWAPKPFAYVSRVTSLATDQNGHWFAAVKGLGLMRSPNQGETWTSVALPFSPNQAPWIAAKSNALWTASKDSGPFVSQDNGQTWQKAANGLPEEGVHALRTGPQGRLFAVSADGKGLYHLKGKDFWEKINVDDGFDYSAWDMLFLPNGEAVVWGYNDVLFSRDGMTKWRRERISQAYRDLWVDSGMKIWTRRMMSTFAFTPEGLEFSKGDNSTAPGRYTFFMPLTDARFAAIDAKSGIEVLTLKGEKLKSGFRGMGNKKVLCIAVDEKGTLLAGSESGLFISKDEGKNWLEVNLEP